MATTSSVASLQNEQETEMADASDKSLVHKLLVSSEDGKIKNLLCPIELVFESQNFSAPLIPSKYDPNIFCLFQNVSSNSYRASTPKTTSRKRKNDRNTSRIPTKKRKKLHHKFHKKNNHMHDEEDIDLINTRSMHDGDDFFSFQPHLNVHSRPKRQRKKVSYKEIDNNITYIPIKPRVRSPKNHKSSAKSSAKSSSKSSTKSTTKSASNPVRTVTVNPVTHFVESVVEMRWVQCDKCLKWRRIPTSVSDAELEGEWTCSMNKWDLKRASCVAEEEAYDLAEEQTIHVNSGRNNQSHRDKKKEFYANLQNFYESTNLESSQNLNIKQLEMAKIGNRQVDFLQLYLEVTKRGGYHYCITNSSWEQVFASLSCFQSNLATKQANLSLQNLYATYLIDYEGKYFKH